MKFSIDVEQIATSISGADTSRSSLSFRRSTVAVPGKVESGLLAAAIAATMARVNGTAQAGFGIATGSGASAQVEFRRAVVNRSMPLGDLVAQFDTGDWTSDDPAGASISRVDPSCLLICLSATGSDQGTIDRSGYEALRTVRAAAGAVFISDPENGEVRLDYRVEEFDQAGAQRILNRVFRVADQIRSDSSVFCEHLSLVDEEELAEILAPRVARLATSDVRIDELFDTQAQTRPSSVAVCDGNQTITYDELRKASDDLAARLRSVGVKPGELVAVEVPRSSEAIAAILGVLKAGGAYVPLDPAVPEARRSTILEIASPCARIRCHSSSNDCQTFHSRVAALELEILSAGGAGAATGSEATAYVLFTSGSTGRPKGVEVLHRNVTRLFETTKPLFEFSEEDVWLNAHNLSFDASVWEVFGPLTTGGRVVIAQHNTVRDPQLLLDTMEEQGVTMLTATPTAFDGLRDVALAAGASFDRLRYVVLCAETLVPSSLRPWFARWGETHPRLVNMYGITETTVHSTFRSLGLEDVLDGRSLIGEGLPDTPIYVLDETGHPAPFDAVGEIYVGGPGVARRYFYASEEDHKRFLADPFVDDASARMYRSGDLARRLRGGGIEYLGRRDHQVKIRGHRIELGEIAAAAQAHPDVTSARAWLYERPSGPPALSIAVVAAKECSNALSTETLRAYLEARLPAYMVPVGYAFVDALPQTPNGKLDVSKLPDPFASQAAASTAPLEPSVAEISQTMSTVLGVDHVPPDESFFALGGDSIMAVRLVARLRNLGWQVNVADVYRSQTPRALAGLLNASAPETTRDVGTAQANIRLGFADRLDGIAEFPATRLQHAMLLQNKLDGRSYQDIHSYCFDCVFDTGRFRAALDSVADANAALRSAFKFYSEKGLVQMVHPAAQIECSFEDWRSTTSESIESAIADWAEAERTRPFDEIKPGLLRVFVQRLGATKSAITLSIHHAILDGWSVATLVTQIVAAYVSENPAERRAPDGTDVLRRFAALEQGAESSDDHLRFWKDFLQNCAPWRPPLALQPSEPHRVRRQSVSLPRDALNRLREVARSTKTPMRTVGFALHAATLSFLSGRSSTTTGLVSNGRLEEEGGDTALGLFLNTLPVTVDVNQKTPIDLVTSVFDQELLVQPYRRLPLERIQKISGKENLCSSAFNYTDFHVYREFKNIDVDLLDISYFEETDLTFVAALHADPVGDAASLIISHRLGKAGEAFAADYAALFLALAQQLDCSDNTPVSETLVSIATDLGLVLKTSVGSVVEVGGNLIDPIEARLAEIPARLAVSIGDVRWSYADIDRAAGALSQQLHAAGARRGDRIACFVARGADPAIAMIAAWRIGASYVPIETSLPANRKRELLNMAECSVALRSESVELDPALWNGECVMLSASCEPLNAAPLSDAKMPRGADDEAYLLFTSGSTGVPKPISIAHGVLANLIDWQIRQPECHEARRISQFAALSFDVSVQEMTTALCSGRSLHVVPEDVRRNPRALLEFLRDEAIDTAFLPPAALRQLASAASAFSIIPGSLKYIVAAGEQLIVTEGLRVFCSTLGARVVNQYGPTETHVVTFHRLENDPDEWPERVPIGGPIDNAKVVLRDPLGRPIYRFAEGEMWLMPHKDGLRSGPGSGEEELWHRSGDIATVIDGALLFLGRADAQVKIRGHRVYPDEAAAVLARHKGVLECVVEAVNSPLGSLELVAFAVVDRAKGVSSADLLAFAREALPEYSVPSRVEIVGQLPTTPRGKTDSRSLRARKPLRPRPDIANTATVVEQRALKVWSKVIGQPVTSPIVSFFDAGGTSLNILELYLGLEQEFGVQFPISALFDLPTARAFVDRYLDDTTEPADQRPGQRA